MEKGLKDFLFISYQFPPRGGPGVHRSTNFAKHLYKYGYNPIVLTINENDIERAGYKVDYSLLDQLPEGLKIVRTPSKEPIGLIRFFMKLRLYRILWILFFPWLFEWSARWPKATLETAIKLIKEHDIDVVYTSSSPFSSWKLGYMLKKRTGVKWVADIRDPYTDGYMWQFPTKFHWFMARRFENRMLSEADKIIVNTPEVEKLYKKRKFYKENKITYLTNGY